MDRKEWKIPETSREVLFQEHVLAFSFQWHRLFLTSIWWQRKMSIWIFSSILEKVWHLILVHLPLIRQLKESNWQCKAENEDLFYSATLIRKDKEVQAPTSIFNSLSPYQVSVSHWYLMFPPSCLHGQLPYSINNKTISEIRTEQKKWGEHKTNSAFELCVFIEYK